MRFAKKGELVAKKYNKLLITLPWLKQGLYTNIEPKIAYDYICKAFDNSGFQFLAVDMKALRFCAHQRGRRKCTCVHVIWVRSNRQTTYISYGIVPRYWFFWLCNHGDHLDKLYRCASLIRKAIDQALVIK